MELVIAGILAVAVLVAVTVFARRLGVATPIILVLAGIGISLIPRVPQFDLPPDVVLHGLLPPILYAAAISLPLPDFRRNLAPIASLAVVLVLISAGVVGVLLWGLLPGLGLAVAVAVGAIVSPPDAVAATSVGRTLGLPPRLLTVLEGEGLVNDATALVLLRSALGVAAGTLTSVWMGVADFAWSAAVAILIGLIVGFITVFVRSKLDDPALDAVISIAVPFLAYVPANGLGASGVLSVVMAGLYAGYVGPRRLSVRVRASDRQLWRMIQFILENGVFLIIGLEFGTFIEDAERVEFLGAWHAVGVGLLVMLALIVIRFVWIGPLLLLLRRGQRRAESRERHGLQRLELVRQRLAEDPRLTDKPRIRRRFDRVEARFARKHWDLEHIKRERFTWRSGVILGWSGMRGVVTLAAAQSLPLGTPYRSALILIACTVAVGTLLLQGFTLPWVIRRVAPERADPDHDREELDRLLEEVDAAGLAVLDDPAATLGVETSVDPVVVERVRRSSEVRTAIARQAQEEAGEAELSPAEAFRRLRLAVVQAEREGLLSARASGRYSTRAIEAVQDIIDREELQLRREGSAH